MRCGFIDNYPLSEVCSMRVGGPARLACLPSSADELCEAISFCKANNIRYCIAGKASNLLFDDSGFDGCVIFTGNLRSISCNDDGIISAECGVTLGEAARTALNFSLSGFEFAFGIPGSVGGGCFMNAGAYGGQISDIFLDAICLAPDGKTVTLTKSEMNFGYRDSILAHSELVLLSARFAPADGDKRDIKLKMEANMQSRRDKQPLEYPSCGSVFKRPEGHFAGALIEQCGLKGLTVGGAQVSHKHAGFIINIGNATTADVLELIDRVKATVLERTSVTLEPEIRIIR